MAVLPKTERGVGGGGEAVGLEGPGGVGDGAAEGTEGAGRLGLRKASEESEEELCSLGEGVPAAPWWWKQLTHLLGSHLLGWNCEHVHWVHFIVETNQSRVDNLSLPLSLSSGPESLSKDEGYNNKFEKLEFFRDF